MDSKVEENKPKSHQTKSLAEKVSKPNKMLESKVATSNRCNAKMAAVARKVMTKPNEFKPTSTTSVSKEPQNAPESQGENPQNAVKNPQKSKKIFAEKKASKKYSEMTRDEKNKIIIEEALKKNPRTNLERAPSVRSTKSTKSLNNQSKKSTHSTSHPKPPSKSNINFKSKSKSNSHFASRQNSKSLSKERNNLHNFSKGNASKKVSNFHDKNSKEKDNKSAVGSLGNLGNKGSKVNNIKAIKKNINLKGGNKKNINQSKPKESQSSQSNQVHELNQQQVQNPSSEPQENGNANVNLTGNSLQNNQPQNQNSSSNRVSSSSSDFSLSALVQNGDVNSSSTTENLSCVLAGIEEKNKEDLDVIKEENGDEGEKVGVNQSALKNKGQNGLTKSGSNDFVEENRVKSKGEKSDEISAVNEDERVFLSGLKGTSIIGNIKLIAERTKLKTKQSELSAHNKSVADQDHDMLSSSLIKESDKISVVSENNEDKQRKIVNHFRGKNSKINEIMNGPAIIEPNAAGNTRDVKTTVVKGMTDEEANRIAAAGHILLPKDLSKIPENNRPGICRIFKSSKQGIFSKKDKEQNIRITNQIRSKKEEEGKESQNNSCFSCQPEIKC